MKYHEGALRVLLNAHLPVSIVCFWQRRRYRTVNNEPTAHTLYIVDFHIFILTV